MHNALPSAQNGPPPNTESFPWTPSQRKIIEAPSSDRILVDAGPGTGKTATACARIAWLLDHGRIAANEICLFSFTRTAVHELRARIAAYLNDPSDIAALRVATIDSYAWAIHSGFNSHASLTGAFDDNIQHVISLIQKHEGVFDYLSTIRHLVVDEAQDVVGPRCELLLEIINALPDDAGVSIFADEAQAIYGFTEDDSGESVEGTLPEKLREFMSDQFTEYDLSEVHRTDDAALLKVFRDGRKLLKKSASSGAERFESVRKLVEQTNHGPLGAYWDDINPHSSLEPDTLLLFRRRGDALAASSKLGMQPHRIRMSGLPVCIHGWIAVLLWDWTRPDLDIGDFERLWKKRIVPSSAADMQKAWSLLIKAFGRSATRISIHKLVTGLANKSPPYNFAMPEFGDTGPVISTIHGSKGREASDVRLYLPKLSTKKAILGDPAEEARIVFVGATRAQKRLHIGSSSTWASAWCLGSSGRAFTPYPFAKGKKTAQAAVEVGHANDIDAVGLVGKNCYQTSGEALAAQARVMELQQNMAELRAVGTNAHLAWRYKIEIANGDGPICYLSKVLNDDLFKIAEIVDKSSQLGKRKPPAQLNHLHALGIRTLAISPDSPIREQLHAPWRDSGLIAAPMLVGYSMAFFR